MIYLEGVVFNKIDIKAAKENNVFVCNNLTVNSGTVAEQAILLMLATIRIFREGVMMIRRGQQIQVKG